MFGEPVASVCFPCSGYYKTPARTCSASLKVGLESVLQITALALAQPIWSMPFWEPLGPAYDGQLPEVLIG